jgi:cytoskeletal protein RodZ
MAINTVSKNSIGVILVLLLVIILSESRLFNFFTDTYLGRSMLIVLILIASYLNKILGIVSVLIIIIMFNNSNLFKFEGFETNTNNSNAKDKVQNVKNAIEEKKNSDSSVSTSTSTATTTSNSGSNDENTSTSTSTTPASKINVVTNGGKTASEAKPDVNANIQSKVSTNAIEGFDLQSTENNIKRGKQSNSIPVNSFSRQSTEVAPYEGANFSEGFGVL